MKKLWNEKNNHLLGTAPDQEIARKVGVWRHVVGVWRRHLGIKSFQKRDSVDRRVSISLKKLPDETLFLSAREILAEISESVNSRNSTLVTKERLRRELPIKKSKPLMFRVGEMNVKQRMVKAAFQEKPYPTLQEVADCLSLTRERVRQILGAVTLEKRQVF